MTERKVMVRAWLAGFAILLTADSIWFTSLLFEVFSDVLVILLWASPFLAGLATAYLAPSHKMVVGASMALPAAILIGLLNFIHGKVVGPGDFSGIFGSITLMLLYFVWGLLGSAVGALVGRMLSRSPHASPHQPRQAH